MIQTRKSLFETNSSSTHAVVVHKNTKPENEDRNVTVWDDEDTEYDFCFGRQTFRLVQDLTDKFAYAYIVVKDISEWTKHPDNTNKFLDIVFNIGKNKGYFGKEDKTDEFSYLVPVTETYIHKLVKKIDYAIENYNAYVDHIEDFKSNGFYEKLISDEDFVRRLIFDNESYITIGGDEYLGYYIKTIGFEDDYNSKYKKSFEQIYDEEGYPTIVDPSEIYDGPFWTKVKKYKEKFEVFFKGN